MTQTTQASPASTVVPQGLFGRLIGVLFSPRTAYAEVAARPVSMGALVVGLLLVMVPTYVYLSTQVGQDAQVDQQIAAMEAFGVDLPPEAYDRMEASAPNARYWSAGGQLVTIPIMIAAIAGLIIVVFNFVMGGEATFRQAFAVVSHAGLIFGLGAVFATPLNYIKGSMASRANLALFAPFLPDTSFAARMLGVIDLFWVWWMVNLAIGLGVLYKRKTGPIATTFLVLYGVVAIAYAAIRSFAGA